MIRELPGFICFVAFIAAAVIWSDAALSLLR